MKTLLLNLWAWVLLHPSEIAEAIGMVLSLIAAASVGNAMQEGKPKSWPAKFVDALAARTRKGAINGPWSWPLVGKSIFDAAMEASKPAVFVVSSLAPPSEDDAKRAIVDALKSHDTTAPQRPSVMPPSSGEVQ